jgi:hypothetical protein
LKTRLPIVQICQNALSAIRVPAHLGDGPTLTSHLRLEALHVSLVHQTPVCRVRRRRGRFGKISRRRRGYNRCSYRRSSRLVQNPKLSSATIRPIVVGFALLCNLPSATVTWSCSGGWRTEGCWVSQFGVLYRREAASWMLLRRATSARAASGTVFRTAPYSRSSVREGRDWYPTGSVDSHRFGRKKGRSEERQGDPAALTQI